MEYWLWWKTVVLVVLCLLTLYTDLRWGLIFNWYTFPAIAIGLVLQTLAEGQVGFLSAIGGTVLGFCLLLPGGMMGMVGAGDLKLQAAIGSLMGGYFVLWVFLWSSCAAPFYAVPLYLVRSGGIQGLLELYVSLKEGQFLAKRVGDPSKKYVYFHGPAIVIGALLTWLMLYYFNFLTYEKIFNRGG